jgi:hypothetical protein
MKLLSYITMNFLLSCCRCRGNDCRSLLYKRHVWNLRRLSDSPFSLFWLTTFCVLQWFFSFNSLTLCRWWNVSFWTSMLPDCMSSSLMGYCSAHFIWQPRCYPKLLPLSIFSWHTDTHTQMLWVIKAPKKRKMGGGIQRKENMKNWEDGENFGRGI